MQNRSVSGVSIRAITAAFPDKIVSFDTFDELFGEKEARRIAKGTGINSIREAGYLNTSDMILAACKNMIENGGVTIDNVDCVIVVTQTPDRWSPGISFYLQDKLGLSTDCFTLDILTGCAGYITGLFQAASLISSKACKKVLLCTGDTTTKIIDDNDRHLKMLFGDAASATLLEAGTDTLDFILGADGSGIDALGAGISYCKEQAQPANTICSLQMDGTAVMNFALTRVPSVIKELLKKNDLTTETVDLLVLHQANEFMIKYLASIIGISPDKLPIDLDQLGNTSSTSIPYVLSRHTSIGTSDAQNVVLCGFGAGLSWGAVKVNLADTLSVSPICIPAN
ncbi:3-oxoacyl-ACP synthase III family protein [Oceanospirillum maris]|uniref:3-oxoacyl-ACP synthase III family protein n=1 Tax=Oceanospirillum maris TaxID=64977 RepID=UPI0003F9E5E0|nr:ketoacyl-ACP synthase III [Oceanospirillum maris]